MNKFVITEEERNSILGMHVQATKNQYLGEQYTQKVEGTLMGAVDGYMMSNMLKDFKDKNKVFIIGSIDGDVMLPNKKMLKTTDNIIFNGNGQVVAYPKDNMDMQFIIKPNKGKITVYRGS
jgi:hypothetical protein